MKTWIDDIGLLALVIAVCAVGIFALMDQRDNLLAENAGLKELVACGVPQGREVIHITPRLDGLGYDCSVSRWKDGQYFVQRKEM